ncbi:hypothetical protein Bcav_1846 [Beutenbergia cavernae DSM 12333]|uniref:SPOR domain-containing protein n=1 Tax=Beutenbergia cavernae (strain ATCC BAA-8 / DSM 12333 / CCUG 43141 / JCM 11478 / NBRC 16432 / NCIMB 13614 / HKI 0122) TaxID=471853 RepID=C5C4X4_BEUC1|nr:hypothetical protein [Beutenbergia cavernae]ACQ80102.1 hypothetical protein Bcav_1846 [Beutenbergia cavernae DSM 12333]
MARNEQATGHGDTSGFYFNLATGEVEHGMVSSWRHRMGPYATRQDAENALVIARARSEDWDDDDRAWREGGGTHSQ